jgi:hypothetical protein
MPEASALTDFSTRSDNVDAASIGHARTRSRKLKRQLQTTLFERSHGPRKVGCPIELRVGNPPSLLDEIAKHPLGRSAPNPITDE